MVWTVKRSSLPYCHITSLLPRGPLTNACPDPEWKLLLALTLKIPTHTCIYSEYTAYTQHTPYFNVTSTLFWLEFERRNLGDSISPHLFPLTQSVVSEDEVEKRRQQRQESLKSCQLVSYSCTQLQLRVSHKLCTRQHDRN